MTRRKIEIESSTLAKALFIFIILLLAGFFLGLYIGRSSDGREAALHTDENCNEIMTACAYKLEGLTKKFGALKRFVKKQKLYDEKGQLRKDMVCSATDTKRPSEDKKESSVEKAPGENEVKKEAKMETAVKPEPQTPKADPVSKKENASPRKKSGNDSPDKKKEANPSKVDISDVMKQLDNLDQKKDNIKSNEKEGKCAYAIQLFSGRNREQAVSAKKRLSIRGIRLVKGTVKGSTWYRLRYGCFGSKEEAEIKLPSLRRREPSAIVISN